MILLKVYYLGIVSNGLLRNICFFAVRDQLSVYIGFKALTVVIIKGSVFWNITACSLLSHLCLLPGNVGDVFFRNVV
jgi:hypothetical protein